MIETPSGIGRFFDYKDGRILVEMDNSYLVEFDAGECYLIKGV